MDVTINNENGKTLVSVAGRIDTSTAEAFDSSIAPLMQYDAPDIEIDCSALEYTSSVGLRIFLTLQKNVTLHGGKLLLKDMKPQVREVFDITGFSHIIMID